MNNHYLKKHQGWQYFLSVLLFFTLLVINCNFVTAINEDKTFDISTINIDLGAFDNKPTVKEISTKIKELNSNLNKTNMKQHWDITVQDLNDPANEYQGKAIVIAKESSSLINGQIELYFRIKKDLNEFIKNKNLGEFELNKIDAKTPEIEELKTVIQNLNPDLDINEVECIEKDLESGKLMLQAKKTSLKYKGKIRFNFQIKKINKSDIIKEIKKNYNFKNAKEEKNFNDALNNILDAEFKQKNNATKESVLQAVKQKIEIDFSPTSNTTQENTTQENTTQENTTQENTTQENTTQENTTQENTTQENIIHQNSNTILIQDENDIKTPSTEERSTLTQKTTNNNINSQNNKYWLYALIIGIVTVLLIFIGVLLFPGKKRDNLETFINA
ncbi:hypothetical protein [Candidatus Phytoplasma solani]